MAEQRSWEGLFPELVGEISDHLTCPADLFRMSRACPAWGAALLPPRRPRLPCLLVPRGRSVPGSRSITGWASCTPCDCLHPVLFPEKTRSHARFFGAYEGGWVFISAGPKEEEHASLLLNFRTGQGPLPLPRKMLFGLEEVNIVIRAATLSSPPEVQGCICGGIATSPTISRRRDSPDHIVLWRMGSQLAPYSREVDEDLEDVVFHCNAFYFLTGKKNLLIVGPESAQEAHTEDQLIVRLDRLQFQSPADEDNCPYLPNWWIEHGGYLVESRRELLMVVRTWPEMANSPEPTSSIRVFRINKACAESPKSDHEYSWEELPELDGRMLFVGRGCSRSYEVEDFPGSQEGVYFSDEKFKWSDFVFGCLYGFHTFYCRDIGICLALPDNFRRLYPDLPPWNYSSSPVWFLH